MITKQHRIAGSILAAVAGDVLGAPFEGAKLANPTDEQLADKTAHPWHQTVWPKVRELHEKHDGWITEPVETSGMFSKKELTDDSHHLLVPVDSFTDLGKFDMFDIAERFLGWYDGGLGKGCGGVTGVALQQVEQGAQWFESGIKARALADATGFVQYKGRKHEVAYPVPIVPSNGALMRSGVAGLIYGLDHYGRELAVAQLTRLTHDFHECVEAAQIHAYITALGVAGSSIDAALVLARDRYRETFDAAVAIPSSKFAHAGGAITSLGIAIASLSQGSDLRDVLMRAVAPEKWTEIERYGTEDWACPDRDTYAEIAGQMAGAFHGLNAVPIEWVDGVHPRSLNNLLQTAQNFGEAIKRRNLTLSVDLA